MDYDVTDRPRGEYLTLANPANQRSEKLSCYCNAGTAAPVRTGFSTSGHIFRGQIKLGKNVLSLACGFLLRSKFQVQASGPN